MEGMLDMLQGNSLAKISIPVAKMAGTSQLCSMFCRLYDGLLFYHLDMFLLWTDYSFNRFYPALPIATRFCYICAGFSGKNEINTGRNSGRTTPPCHPSSFSQAMRYRAGLPGIGGAAVALRANNTCPGSRNAFGAAFSAQSQICYLPAHGRCAFSAGTVRF